MQLNGYTVQQVYGQAVVIDREYHYTCGLTVVKHIPAYYNALLWEAPFNLN